MLLALQQRVQILVDDATERLVWQVAAAVSE